ncbi:SAF domain-containing protein [Actinocatenispora rupis]|uniref:SAF domain-containing protein n=1 Tax=Actinocatenispora rupis TaxID=519421 RepID=A0A8J3NDB4_9ACTN|nr:SAF domain-containing protein [Actinocatenispora rupis]GID14886.1 hypothetical protein Aru02nite_57750 [Actinocatenispora rupis]
MATTAVPATQKQLNDASPAGPAMQRASAPRRWLRRHGLRLAGAVLAIGAGAGIAAGVAAATNPRTDVVVVSRPIVSGRTVSAADLRSAKVAVDDSVPTVSWDQRDTVIGQRASVPLAAGAVFAEWMVGPQRWPGPGQAVAAVTLKPGQFPPSIAAGSPVDVLFVPGPNTGSGARDSGTAPDVAGVVLSLRSSGAGDGSTVVELVVPLAGAQAIASAPAVTLLATH